MRLEFLGTHTPSWQLAEFGAFLLVEPEPAVLWTNGGHSWIQRVKYV